MKCKSCNSELKDGAKFCTKCGTPIKKVEGNNSVANIDNTIESANTDKSMSSIKGMIFWDVQQGEIARRINESEFVQYDSATGVIINDGTTVQVRSGGVKVAELSGGVYNFIDPKELDKILESRVGGVAEGLKRGFKGLFNILLGRKVKDRVTDDSEVYKQNSVEEIIKCMQQNTLLSLTLKLDKDFDLLFGESHSSIDDYSDFKPMNIRTRYLDVKMGVRATFKITDFAKFAQHYLSDKGSVSTSYLAHALSPIINSTIQRIMGDIELTNHAIPEDIHRSISSAITTAANEAMYGISLIKVIEITIEDENIERLRTLSRELYLSEKELDFLVRTNDFKNRLNIQVDQQDIYDARRTSERDNVLRDINRDEILNLNEFDKFRELLALETRLRNTRNEAEIDALNDELATNKFERLHAQNHRRERAIAEIESIELERIRIARISTAQTDIEEQRIRDDHQFSVEDRKHEQDEKKAMSAIERLRVIKKMEQEEEDISHKKEMDKLNTSNAHEININKTNIDKLDTMSNLSPEQLMAIAANENMSPEAAAKFAESFSEKHKGANQAESMDRLMTINQERINDKDRDADRMERMMREMMSTASSIAGGTTKNSENLKNEYKERLERQEDRIDKTQDRALDYSTKNNSIHKQSGGGVAEEVSQIYYQVDIEGKEEIKQSFSQIVLMVRKGIVKEDTYIFSSSSNDWIVASNIKELKHLFI